ncbi:unnamed protein product [Acanthoscelides obtectus]|uniref:Lipase n=1 Tax=Acanthoscelides obtectus TaxID=200917 RepID=A0A9P0PNB3_ACAOB|nr:unnamed protein product [Acanthoscelides obtectus]CAK1639360.1 Lipase 3 [Acanthoscelides obtectus]
MHCVRIVVLLLFLSISSSLEKKDDNYRMFIKELHGIFRNRILPSDYGLNITKFVPKKGYLLESHEVTTEDGYILTLHRIPYGRNHSKGDNQVRPPVLLMHGFLMSSMDWVYLGPDKSLGLLLADAGYDVWMGNVRGTTWSRKHVKLDPDKDKEFWEFSFHEHGYYDIPACIDYILNMTNQSQLYYIGHSQGTTELFVLTSMRPEYNNKIKHGIALAPVAYMTDARSQVVDLVVKFEDRLKVLFNIFNVHEVLASSRWMKAAGRLLCADGSPFQEICPMLLFSICGYDYPQLNKTFLPTLIFNSPSGTSVKNLEHFYVLISSGKFTQFDYGREENLGRYNSTTPSEYDLSRITAPITMYISQNDYLSSVKKHCHTIQLMPDDAGATRQRSAFLL